MFDIFPATPVFTCMAFAFVLTQAVLFEREANSSAPTKITHAALGAIVLLLGVIADKIH